MTETPSENYSPEALLKALKEKQLQFYIENKGDEIELMLRVKFIEALGIDTNTILRREMILKATQSVAQLHGTRLQREGNGFTIAPYSKGNARLISLIREYNSLEDK